jgi:hypothetical protein
VHVRGGTKCTTSSGTIPLLPLLIFSGTLLHSMTLHKFESFSKFTSSLLKVEIIVQLVTKDNEK